MEADGAGSKKRGAAAAAAAEDGDDDAAAASRDGGPRRPRRRREIPPTPPPPPSIPVLRSDPAASALIPHGRFREAYGRYRAAHLPGPLTLRRRGSGVPCGDGAPPSGERGGGGADGEGGEGPSPGGGAPLTWRDLHALFGALRDSDKSSWTIEDAEGAGGAGAAALASSGEQEEPGDFLRPDGGGGKRARRGYCSFLVQHDADAMRAVLDRAPLAELPVAAADAARTPPPEDDARKSLNEDADGDSSIRPHEETREPSRPAPRRMKARHGPCLWVFFGRNEGSNDDHGRPPPPPLEGRPEHTDSVSHDGTWHYQLSGTKIWKLRPTKELLDVMRKNGLDERDRKAWFRDRGAQNVEDAGADGNGEESEKEPVRVEVVCREGDVLLLNTRLWWHATTIPPQDEPSVSYARDVYLDGSSAAEGTHGCAAGEKAKEGEEDGAMTNVDGLYAAEDVSARTILFTELTMPECELHRSATDPNCEVVELDDGTGMAVVSRRDIKAGEFFCVAESDEEEEEEEGECEGDGSDFEEVGDDNTNAEEENN